MRRDKNVDRRILLAIEAKRSRAPAPIHVDSVGPQDMLDHLASMYEEGLYSGPKPVKSGSTGEVALAPVGDLTPGGRQRLKELNDEYQQNLNEFMRGKAVTFGPEPEAGQSSADSYVELQARVVLLELSLNSLRAELAAPRNIGIGHNKAPDWPVPEEELKWADELVALLKDRGPVPPDNRKPLLQQYEKAAGLAERIQSGLVSLGQQIASGAARELGRQVLSSHWTAVSHWIVETGRWLLTWLGLG